MAAHSESFWQKYWWIFLLIGAALLLLLVVGGLTARKQSNKGAYKIVAYNPAGPGPAPIVVGGASI